jgi:hypothetical protein
MQDAPNDGLTLVSGARSPWQQYLLRRDRVGAALAFNRNYPGHPRTAIPYSSNHQKGLAADMGGRDLSWLIAQESRYGLARTVRSENWHFEAVGNPVVRIIPWPGGLGQQIPHGTEGFGTMTDAEINAKFDELDAKLNKIIGGLMVAEKDRFEPTTRRVRELWEHAGLDD